jgi:hypothetical protein
MMVFMTRINRPNVRRINGNVKKVMMGLMKAFNNAKTIATTMAVPKFFT